MITLVCILLLPCVIGLAEEAPVVQAKEITFRGHPLGSSISEVKAKLISEGVAEESIKVSETDYGYRLYCYFDYNSGFPLKLADYSIDLLQVIFDYTIQDGMLLKSQEDAGLVSADYTIDDSAYGQKIDSEPDHTLVMKILSKYKKIGGSISAFRLSIFLYSPLEDTAEHPIDEDKCVFGYWV